MRTQMLGLAILRSIIPRSRATAVGFRARFGARFYCQSRFPKWAVWRVVVYATCGSMVASCQALGVNVCNSQSEIEESALVKAEIAHIIEQSKSPITGYFSYNDRSQFLRINKGCCFISGDPKRNGTKITLPMESETKVTVIFRKLSNSSTPYAAHTVTYGTCPTNRTYSERILEEKSWNDILKIKWGRNVSL